MGRCSDARGGRSVRALVVVPIVGALVFAGAVATPGAVAAAVLQPPTAYVANGGSGTVTPIDLATNAPGTPIRVGKFPSAIAITPDGRTAYVTDKYEGAVVELDLTHQERKARIPVGNYPDAIAITPDGTTAYVANGGSSSVTPIDLTTNTAGTPIPVPIQPNGIAITPDGRTAYVAGGFGDVTPIDIATNTAGDPIQLGFGPVGIVITPDGRTAYVADASLGRVDALDIATNTPGRSKQVASAWAIAIKPHAGTAYVASFSAGSGAIIPVHLPAIHALSPIPVGSAPIAIAFTPDGSTAFAVNSMSDSVTPIDATTGTAGTPISVGSNPQAIAITPDQAPVARFTVTAASAGSPSQFDAGGSFGRSTPVTRFHWNFGDGTVDVTGAPTTTHVYAASGSYTVRLIVTDAAGTSIGTVYTGQMFTRHGGSTARHRHSVTIP